MNSLAAISEAGSDGKVGFVLESVWWHRAKATVLLKSALSVSVEIVA
jgi:hypothetical protein